MKNLNQIYFGIFISMILILFSFKAQKTTANFSQIIIQKDTSKVQQFVIVQKNIQIKNYFQYIDSIVHNYNLHSNYNLTEHILVRYNPFILQNLVNTDYYLMMQKGIFVYNQKNLIVLNKGDTILIPDDVAVQNIIRSMQTTRILINIPEFKLRIYEDTIVKYTFAIRVGRNEKKFLKMANTTVDLKTKTGIGTITNHVKNPDFYNPVTNHKYYLTVRDDKKTTKMPQIPWIETEINGIKNGQLIHPTTNPVTLNKAYSNGCIGLKESDAWVVYYYSPIGTKISIIYELVITTSEGKKHTLNDIYNYSKTHITQ